MDLHVVNNFVSCWTWVNFEWRDTSTYHKFEKYNNNIHTNMCADNLLKKPWNKQLKTETGGNFCSVHFQNWFHKTESVANIQAKAGNIVAWNYL